MSPVPHRPVVGVLLAAGAGRLLGRGPKALLTVDGTPQVVRMTRALLRGGCEAVVVVLGASHAQVLEVLEAALAGTPEGRRVRIVVNPDWESGMGSSFRAGTEAADRLSAPSGASAGSVLVSLVDQPDVGAAVVRCLLAAAADAGASAASATGPRVIATGLRVIAAGYRDASGRLVRGHPLVFPRPWAREAAALAAGDAAGRVWLRRHPEVVDLVDVGHLATGRDVDTPQDLAAQDPETLSRGTEADVRA